MNGKLSMQGHAEPTEQEIERMATERCIVCSRRTCFFPRFQGDAVGRAFHCFVTNRKAVNRFRIDLK